jgi:DNA polymerase III subunit epsilon
MADAEVAAALLARIQRDLERRYDVFDCDHALLVKLQKAPKKKLPDAIRNHLDGLKAAMVNRESSSSCIAVTPASPPST